MNIYILLLILFIHWVFDFIVQTRNQALNKHKCIKALLGHTAIYSLAFFVFFLTFNLKIAGIFALTTFCAHTIIDYFTSKINQRYWDNKQFRKFFVLLGFDQFLHAAQLILTYYWLS